jgi:DNA gyrase subunit A
LSTGSGDSGALGDPPPERIQQLDIRDEMQNSYLTYAMSVIISRALPDARDGLKPSQRRILVAMNDLNLPPGGATTKCAGIVGETMKRYHPHGDGAIYPTLARMAQNWVMRETLIAKQGNFGSLAGLPPAQMRYTEAKLSGASSDMLSDIDLDTVDYVSTYDQLRTEPVVLPSKFPNLLVNGSTGIAVGMATSIPPHNLCEVADAAVLLIDEPEASIDQIIEVLPGPDFATGGTICGRYGIRKGYLTGRSTITLRAKSHYETEKNSDVIVITEIPYMETRDRIREKLEILVREERVKGISRIVDLTDRKTPSWQVRLHVVLKKDADKEVVLNQLFQFSSLQTTVSVIVLALVGDSPKVLNIKELIQQFLRHRVDVIRRRTEFLLAEARKRKHTVEGLLIAQLNIDQVIATIRAAKSRADAKVDLQGIEVPAELIARALGETGFENFTDEHGSRDMYSLSPNQSEAIVSMQLGSLANLEREKLIGEFHKLLEDIISYLHLLSDETHILAIVREDMLELRKKYPDKRRTEISDEELTDVNRDDLITEETMVVTLSQRGYIKRMALDTYQAQNRGGKGITGAKSGEEDAIEHLFISSTHSFLLFFTNYGKVYWQKVYDLPLQSRTAKGRALVNLLALAEGEQVENCIGVRDFDDEHFLILATRSGTVKKTALSQYSRPKQGGLIAIRLKDGDELVDVVIVGPGDDVLISTSSGMAIRFPHTNARPMGRATAGVRGVRLGKNDELIGIVVATPSRSLLTVCENGYGKRTPIGIGGTVEIDGDATDDDLVDDAVEVESDAEPETDAADVDESSAVENSGEEVQRSGFQYRSQKRGGKGVRDIRTTARNGKAVAILAVNDDDEVLMVTGGGKIQRVRVADISVVGRNTQGVRIIRLDKTDTLASMARIPSEIIIDEPVEGEGDAAAEGTETSEVVENTGDQVTSDDQAADAENETPTSEDETEADD